MLPPMTIAELTAIDRQTLLNAIADRAGTARELAAQFDCTTEELRAFAEDNAPLLTSMRQALIHTALVAPSDASGAPSPTQLADLWLSNKFQRLKRYQDVADILFRDLSSAKLAGADLSTAAREFRSYLQLAANELGQLLHRGAGEGGDGDTLSIDIQGVDINDLK